MRIVITGATGLVGRHLCRRWHREKHELIALTRDPERARRQIPELFACYGWDPLDGTPPPQAIEGAEIVVNLAGETVVGRWTAEKRRRIRDSRTIGTRHLVAGMAAAAARPRMLVSASAVGYYGDRGDERLTEDSGAGDDFLAHVCRDWEREAASARDAGMLVAVCRLGIVLDHAGGAFDRMLKPARLGLSGRLGTGRQWWSWVHIDDVARAIEQIMARGLDGPTNVTAPEPLRQADFAGELARALGRPALLPTPAALLRIGLGGFASELLSSKRVEPRRLAETEFEFSYPSLQPAIRALLEAGA